MVDTSLSTAADSMPLTVPRGSHARPKAERPRFQSVKVSLLGRYMLPSKREFPCQTTAMSPGDVVLVGPVVGAVADPVIAYIDHIGRLEGRIQAVFDGGFAMSIEATLRKRDKLADQLTWLANRHALNLPEDRRHERTAPRTNVSQIALPDGRSYSCRILDLSLSGAAISMNVTPAIGTPVALGRLRGRIVRHFEGGIAIEFAAVQTPASLDASI